MQIRPLKLLIACGSGIATSTLAASVVQEVCDEAGIACEIVKGSMMDVPGRASEMDAVLTTNRYREPCPVPVMSIVSFVTGINEDETKEKLIALLNELLAKL